MKMIGICRKIDDLGRIVVPAEYRSSLKVVGGDELEIYMEGDRIILQKPQKLCFLCGSDKNLIAAKDKQLCSSCLAEIKQL